MVAEKMLKQRYICKGSEQKTLNCYAGLAKSFSLENYFLSV